MINLAAEQRALGLSPSVWTMDGPDELRNFGPAAILGGTPCRCFPVSWPRQLWRSAEMLRAAREQRGGEADICHVHGVWTGISVAGEIIQKRTGARTVVTVHGSLDAWARRKSRLKKAVAWWLFQRSALANAACLHATSRKEVEDIRECGLTGPVAVIRNGIDRAWCESEGDGLRFRLSHGIDPGKRLLLFLGRITPKKGLVPLLQALALAKPRTDDWTLIVAGEDEFGHLAEVSAEIKRLGLERGVKFVGGKYGQAKRDCFAGVELMVLPSVSEGDPIVVLESLGAGVPVITTTASPWQELTSTGCGFWVESKPAALAEALEALFRKPPEDLAEMGRRGKDLVLSEYLWEQRARQTRCLYEWVLGLRPDAGGVEVHT